MGDTGLTALENIQLGNSYVYADAGNLYVKDAFGLTTQINTNTATSYSSCSGFVTDKACDSYSVKGDSGSYAIKLDLPKCDIPDRNNRIYATSAIEGALKEALQKGFNYKPREIHAKVR